jgi:hypothetical protein
MGQVSEFWHRFRISSTVMPIAMVENSRMTMSPAAAAKHDPDAFLALADEVAKVAQKLRAEQGQQKLPGLY